jgi:type II secretory pathway pseudopilin PulG
MNTMKHRSPHAFTLVEMITVIAVIIILAGLVLGVSGYVQTAAAKQRAMAEMKAIATQCEAYKNDNGGYPQTGDTDELDPRKHFDPSAKEYGDAIEDLYSALTGDFEPQNNPDGKPEAGNTIYITFQRNQLSFSKEPGTGEIKEIKGIQDPFGLLYGYSTIAAKNEAVYQEKLRANPTEPRASALAGFNPTFDMWSTSGGTTLTQQPKWVKNWGGN